MKKQTETNSGSSEAAFNRQTGLLMRTLSRDQRSQILKSAKIRPIKINAEEMVAMKVDLEILWVEKHGQVKFKIFMNDKMKYSLNLLNIKYTEIIHPVHISYLQSIMINSSHLWISLNRCHILVLCLKLRIKIVFQ